MENESAKNGTFFRFEDLRVYDKAMDYISWIYNATKLFPDDNSKNLCDKLISSSQAIAFYIAEGSARNKSQFIYYLKMAKSSVRECVVLTTTAQKQRLFSDIQIEESRNELMEMTKMIGALIGSLQKNQGKGRYKNSRDNDLDYVYHADSDDELISMDSIDIKKY